MNKHIADMISLLAIGLAKENIQQCRDRGLSCEADNIEREVERFRQHSADLRAAAAAVRLVVECREALEQFDVYRKEGDFGGVSMMLQYGKFDKSATKAIASIAEWEWKHGQ